MKSAPALATAITFVWLGMVLAISFLETPLKFRAPGIDLRLGLGIGRVVFRALNSVEAVLAVVLIAAVAFGSVGHGLRVAAVLPVVVLVAQMSLVRPMLARRSNRVLAGVEGERSRAHLGYVAGEVLKVAALVTVGVVALQG
jgi:uncharacterized protein (UPF0548 family)